MESFGELFKESLFDHIESFAAALPRILLGVLLFLFFLFVAFILRKSLKRLLDSKFKDRLSGDFIITGFYWLVLIIGSAMALRVAGMGGIASGLIAGAGIGAFVIGFAFKDIGENFLAGIMMAFSRPFQIGDTVEVNGVMGVIQTLDLRNTHIKTPDGKDVYIPNGSVVKNNLFNYTKDGFIRHEIILGIDQDDDYDRAIEILEGVLDKTEGVLKSPRKPIVMISGTDTNSVLITIYYWIDTFDKDIAGWQIKSAVTGKSIKTLVQQGFYLPNTIVEVKNYKDQSLSHKGN